MRLSKRNSSFIMLFVIYSVLMLINCILTGSPYSAWHSGRVGAYASSIVFTFNIAYVLLFSVVIVFMLKGCHTYIRNNAYLLCGICIITGFFNRQIFKYTNTYMFDVLMIFLISNLALNDVVSAKKQLRNIEFRFISRIIIFSLLFGLILTLLGGGKYGYLPFDFTRSSRGEVTWWVILFLPVLSCIITVIKKMNNEKIVILSVLASITFIIVLSTSSRTIILLYMVVVAMYVFSQKLSAKKLMFIVIGFIGVLLLWSKIWGFFTLGGSNSVEVVLNGRFGLWKVYWKCFLQNPILGYGPGVYVDKSIGASSEIGLLKDITHYGILFGIVLLIIIVRGIISSIRIVRNYHRFSRYDIFIALINIVSVITFIQQHARIFQFSDYLCWYSIFYMNAVRVSEDVEKEVG